MPPTCLLMANPFLPFIVQQKTEFCHAISEEKKLLNALMAKILQLVPDGKKGKVAWEKKNWEHEQVD